MNEDSDNLFRQEALFDDGAKKPETNEEALERLKNMSAPAIGAIVEKTADFSEDHTLGEEPNKYTPEEGQKIEELVSQGLSLPNAFGQATGRKYIYTPAYPPKRKRKRTKRQHLSARGKLIADGPPEHIAQENRNKGIY